MLSIRVATNTIRKTVSKDVTATPKEVLDELGVDTTTSRITVNAEPCRNLDKTFEQLGIADNSDVSISAIVKADGAMY